MDKEIKARALLKLISLTNPVEHSLIWLVDNCSSSVLWSELRRLKFAWSKSGNRFVRRYNRQ